MQQSIFDQAEKAKNEGIELVWAHADSYWKRAAGEQLQKICDSEMRYLTSEDILLPLERAGITTGDNRAVAALLKAAQRVGLIEPTDVFVRCRRPSRHGAPIMRWEILRKEKASV